jgi:hypothetical protein
VQFLQKGVRICYTELVFSHPVGYAGHKVHSGAPEAQNVVALFLMLGSARCDFHKKQAGTRYSELVFFNLVSLRVM